MNSFPLKAASAIGDCSTTAFLLLCLSPDDELDRDSQLANRIRALVDAAVDWSLLLELARVHRVVPLLYKRLSTICLTDVPKDTLDWLRNSCQRTAVQNIAMTAELSRLLALMNANDIETLPYKGPILTQTLYKRLDLRQFGDLDIIVQPQDVAIVESLLIEEGYWPYFGKKTAAQLSTYMKAKTEHTYDFYHKGKDIFIEIHWRFWPPFFSSVNPKEIWPRRESTTLAGATVSTFPIEDYLIVLCMHGSRHMWERLAWLCDIALLVRRYPDLDWQKTLSTAERWGVKRMLLLGLYLAQSWLATSLPIEVKAQISTDSAIAKLAAQVKGKLFSSAEAPKRPMVTTQYQLQVRERWQDKAVYASSFGYWLLKGRWLAPKVADSAGMSALDAEAIAD